MQIKVFKLVLIYFILLLFFTVTGCSKLAPASNDNNYVLPTNEQIDDYLRTHNLSNIISIDAIDNHYVNILYKIGQDGIGFRVITVIKNRVLPTEKIITISDGKTIYEGKIPEVIVGGTGGRVQFRYVYLDDSISKDAYEIKMVYYYKYKGNVVEVTKKTNQKNCIIFGGSSYNTAVKGLQSIFIYDKNGEKIYENN